MIQRQVRLERIRAVAREFLAAVAALRLLEKKLVADPSWGTAEGWERHDVERLSRNLEATYLIRLFAEFEAGLRDYWERSMGRTTSPPMKHLMVSIAAHRTIPQDWLDDADDVRKERNKYVHLTWEEETDLRLSEATSRVCRFLSRLPLNW